MRLFQVLLLAAVAVSPTVAAADCDPRDHLVKDRYNLKENTSLNIHLFKRDYEKKKGSKRASLSGGYGPYYGDADQAETFFNEVSNEFNYEITDVQNRTIAYSFLSGTSLEAYKACLAAQNDPVSYSIPEGAQNRKDLALSVEWTPFRRTVGGWV